MSVSHSPARARGPIAVLAVIVAAVGVPAAAAGPKRPVAGLCNNPSKVVAHDARWASIALPDVPAKPASWAARELPDQNYFQFDVARTDPAALAVTDGITVMTSSDGGCSWKLAWRLPDAPTPDAPFSIQTATIAELVMVSPEKVHVLVNTTDRAYYASALGARPFFWVRTTDGGATWSSHAFPSDGGDVVDVAVAPSDADRIYVVTSGLPGGCRLVASKDGGRTWAAASAWWSVVTTSYGYELPDLGAVRPYRCPMRIAVDPLDPDSVWMAADKSGILHSADGGVTITREPALVERGVVSDVDVHHAPNEPVKVVATIDTDTDKGVGNNYSTIVRTDDGGTTWQEVPGPGSGSYQGLAFGSDPRVVYMVAAPPDPGIDSRALYRLDPRISQWVQVSPPEIAKLHYWAGFLHRRDRVLYGIERLDAAWRAEGTPLNELFRIVRFVGNV